MDISLVKGGVVVGVIPALAAKYIFDTSWQTALIVGVAVAAGFYAISNSAAKTVQ